jgi:hypothetical protein
MLIENDNAYVEVVIENDNDPLPKTITGKNNNMGAVAKATRRRSGDI